MWHAIVILETSLADSVNYKLQVEPFLKDFREKTESLAGAQVLAENVFLFPLTSEITPGGLATVLETLRIAHGIGLSAKTVFLDKAPAVANC